MSSIFWRTLNIISLCPFADYMTSVDDEAVLGSPSEGQW